MFRIFFLILVIFTSGCEDSYSPNRDGAFDSEPTNPDIITPTPPEPIVPDPPEPIIPEPPEPITPLEQALASGDFSFVKEENVYISAILEEINTIKTGNNKIKDELFSYVDLSSLYWRPTHDAVLMTPTFGLNDTILNANHAYKDGYKDKTLTIGIAGKVKNTTANFIALGSNPMRNFYTSKDDSDGGLVNEQMHQFMMNGFKWLAKRNNFEEKPLTIVSAQLNDKSDSKYFPDGEAVRFWLTERYGDNFTINPPNTCDGSRLSQCVETLKPDVVILSQNLNDDDTVNDVMSSVKAITQMGSPILYMHLGRYMAPLGSELFSFFDIQYEANNIYNFLETNNLDPLTVYNIVPSDILTLLTHIQDNSFSFDLSLCDDKKCDKEKVPTFESEFSLGANAIKNMFNRLDEKKTNIFTFDDDYRYAKLLILLADYYRSHVYFPMDKAATSTITFLKSYFADHAVYNYRLVNPLQPDMGNFSRSDFEQITPATVDVSLLSKEYFRAAGVYALPGQTFTVTRTDSSAVKTKVFINTLRSGATHEFSSGRSGAEKDGEYTRPKFLQTERIPIEPGETIQLTSSYGGTIQIEFDANDINVSFKFSNVGQHPFWKGDNDTSKFAKALDENNYDWAEIVTSGFEVHSKTEKIKKSMTDPLFDTVEKLAYATTRYTSNFPHVVAGFKGPGIDVVPEIHDFAKRKGWDIQEIDVVKHMNSDQANCGSGCSGNPYDAYWAFNPLSHGDLHELGHGLEKKRLRFINWEVHTTTNQYVYYTKSEYYKETGEEPNCKSLPFQELYDLLQQSQSMTNPSEFMRAQERLANWKEGSIIYIQMMMAAQKNHIFLNGWHFLAVLHILEREYTKAISNEANWLEKRESLGFNAYSLAETKEMSENDWLLVAISTVLERDMRSYLTMWGFEFSLKAREQVASFSFSPLPIEYFASEPSAYCKDFTPRALPVDGTTEW